MFYICHQQKSRNHSKDYGFFVIKNDFYSGHSALRFSVILAALPLRSRK